MPRGAKVGEAGWSGGRLEQDGRGLDVAMEDSAGVDECQGVEDICEHGRHVGRGESRCGSGQDRVQGEGEVGKDEDEARFLVPERGDETDDAMGRGLQSVQLGEDGGFALGVVRLEVAMGRDDLESMRG